MSNSAHHPDAVVPSPESPSVRAFALDSWSALQVSGADAETFLQGQLSADLRRLTPDRPLWASYNSPKGRMLAVMQLRRSGACIELRMPRALIEPVAKRLRMFVMRSKVNLLLPELGLVDAQAEARDRVELIRAGVPVVYPETQDRWVAQMANLDLLGGIGFDKGCYTGQEVIARLHYLGNLKKRLFLLRGKGAAPLPGTAIRDTQGDGQSAGEVVDACLDEQGFIASAVLQLSASTLETLALDRDADAPLATPEAYHYLSEPAPDAP